MFEKNEWMDMIYGIRKEILVGIVHLKKGFRHFYAYECRKMNVEKFSGLRRIKQLKKIFGCNCLVINNLILYSCSFALTVQANHADWDNPNTLAATTISCFLK